MGFRFRINVPHLPGKPDIVLKRFGVVIFVHGCFWHGHNCSLFKWPNSRVDFWRNKIEYNKQNDIKVIEALHQMNWRVAIVWECSMKGRHCLGDLTLGKTLVKWIRSKNTNLDLRGMDK